MIVIFKINYKSELNAAQLQVAESMNGPLLVIAGAGTGKTRALTYRVGHLIESGVDPENILLLTFTKKAANEMIERSKSLLDNRCENVTAGTYHSFAAMVLRKYASLLDIENNFTVIDQLDSCDLIKLAISRNNLGYKDNSFPSKGTIQKIISESINKDLSISDIISANYPYLITYIDDIEVCHDSYKELKAEKDLLDYDDLLFFLLKLLNDFPNVAKKLSDKYRYIMVDEYQDSNILQFSILKALCVTHQNIMVVGDDQQSIYRFRGAEFKNIMNFPKAFMGCKLIKLTENYRSQQSILDLSNQVVENAEEKYKKSLTSTIPSGEKPSLISFFSKTDEAEYIVKSILEKQKNGEKLSDIAVLCRNAFHTAELEIQCNRYGIPYNKFGGIKFLEQVHIKDFLSYLRVLENEKDDLAWIRLVSLTYGVGTKNADKILKEIHSLGRWGLLSKKLKKNKYAKDLEVLYDLLVHVDTLPENEKCQYILKHHYSKKLKEIYKDDYDWREKDVKVLIDIANKYKTISSFLTDILLEPPSFNDHSSEEDCLTISTIHSAKGLEWKHVYILHCAEGLFPAYHTSTNIEELEEERRIFYVAITRAKETLTMTYPRSIMFFGKYLEPTISQFLKEKGMSGLFTFTNKR